jgi:hypothetical protein
MPREKGQCGSKNSNVEWLKLERESESARKAIERARELEVVAAERAHLLNEKDKELAVVREAATKYWFRIQELERYLAEIGQK